MRAVLVTGAGDAFCSGGDTGWIGGDPDASVTELRDRMMPFYRAWLSIRDLEIPTIAGDQRARCRRGAAVALACDIRVASSRASFSVPFVKLGIHPGMATTFLLADVAGAAVARDPTAHGRRIGAGEMADLGIVTSVFDESEFAEEAAARAEALYRGRSYRRAADQGCPPPWRSANAG